MAALVIPIKLLSIDQATNILGYAIFDGKELTDYGLLDYSKLDDYNAKISAIKTWIIKTVEEQNITAIAVEDVYMNLNPLTMKTLAKLLGVIENLCYEKQIECTVINNATWRNSGNIKGRTREQKKAGSKKFVLSQFKIKTNDDVADAICIGWHVLCTHGIKTWGETF